MHRLSIHTILLLTSTLIWADEPKQLGTYAEIRDISYRSGDQLSDYTKERCRLDLVHPIGLKDFPTVVWFHGGGLKAGSRSVPTGLQKKGLAVVAVNYRLHPQVSAPTYIEDAAASVAWTLTHIAEYGGDPKRVFVSGHSAGGYLTSMIGYDKRWLVKHGVDADDLAGLIPYSGHTITHFTVRAERGIDGKQPIIDDLAPLFHVRKDAPPTLLVTGGMKRTLISGACSKSSSTLTPFYTNSTATIMDKWQTQHILCFYASLNAFAQNSMSVSRP